MQQTDVVQLAQDLLGVHLVTEINGIRTIGRIVEAEAYRAPEDRASHAWGNRRTKRTETMFLPGGHAYVYLCYGIHQMFNVVTGPENVAHAVLVRAIEPVENTAAMLFRRNLDVCSPRLSSGPGIAAQALGISTALNAIDLCAPGAPIRLERKTSPPPVADVVKGTRVGIAYAEEWAKMPWRFSIRNNPWVSKAKGTFD